MMKTFTFIMLLVEMGAVRQSHAQKPFNAEVAKNALGSDDGYRPRTKDERYEGLYAVRVGAPLLGVISVTQGPISYELADKGQLTIQVPPLAAYKTVGVSGTSFGLNKNYRLDAVIAAGGKKTIPMKDVLSPNYIYGQNLGIYGYIGEPQYPTLYVPVQVLAKNEVATAAPIRVVFLPGTTIDKFTWSFAKSVQGQCAEFREQGSPAAGAMYGAHQPIVITLPAASGLAPGDEVCINVNFKALGDPEWRSKSMRLLITK